MRKVPLYCLTAAALFVVITLALKSGADDNRGERNRGRFNEDVAGSYAVAVDFGEPIPVQALATLTADGGIIATDTDDYGFGIDQRFHSPKHGLWERSGRRSVTATVYEYGFVEDSNTPALVFRLTFLFKFDDDTLTGGTGTVTYAAHLLPALDPGADPLDPESGFVVAGGVGDVTFKRLMPQL